MIIGIHLGANYTRVGIKSVGKNDDPPHILRDIDIPREGNADRIASVVSFHEKRIKIGTDGLKNQEQEIVFDACRVGTDNDNVEENVIWHAKRSSDGTYQVKKKEKQISQEDIVLEILKHIKEILEKRKYGPIKNLVISTPYKSEETYKRTIQNAAINAKFNQQNPVLIEETEAAAKSFYELSIPNQYPHNLLVFKFGAGSFSISLAQKPSKNDGLKILKTTGNPRLGGEDITNLLMQHCLKYFEKDLAEIRKKDLRESCERVKSDLSYFSDTKIIIEGEPRNDINRNLFDEICKNIIDEIRDHMHSITGEMKTREIEIHDVLLVGGSTRLHFIREIIDSALKSAQKSEYRYDAVVIAEEAIALGCAVHGSEPSIEKNGTDMKPTDQDVPNNTDVAPTAQETPNETGVAPTFQDAPNDTGMAPTFQDAHKDTNLKVKEDNHETDEKQKCENDSPQSNTNPTDQDDATLIETLLNNQSEDELRDTSSNDVGMDLVPENPDLIRTNEDNSMNNLIPKAKKDGTKTSKVKESAKKDLHNAIHKKSGTEANKTNDQEDTNTGINSSTKLNATNNDSKQNKKVAIDLIKQVSQPNNTTNDRTNHRKVFKQSTSAHHNNQTHHDHRIEIPQPVTSFRNDRKNTANSKSANLEGNGPSMPVAHQKDIKSERPMHKDHRKEIHHSTLSQQIHLNSTSSTLDHQKIQSYEVNQNSTSFSKQITENRQILKEQSKKTKSADEILALKVQQSKNPNSPVQPPYMNNDEKTKPGHPTVIGNFVKDPSKQAASTKNLVKSSPNPAASSTSYGPQNREPVRDSFKDKKPFMDSPIKRKLYEETRVWYNEIKNCRHLSDEEKAHYQTNYYKKYIQSLRDDYLEKSKNVEDFLAVAERNYQELKYKSDILEQFEKIREQLEYIPDKDLKSRCMSMVEERRLKVYDTSIKKNEKILENFLKEIQDELCLRSAELKNPAKNLKPKVFERLEIDIRNTLIMPKLYYCKHKETNLFRVYK